MKTIRTKKTQTFWFSRSKITPGLTCKNSLTKWRMKFLLQRPKHTKEWIVPAWTCRMNTEAREQQLAGKLASRGKLIRKQGGALTRCWQQKSITRQKIQDCSHALKGQSQTDNREDSHEENRENLVRRRNWWVGMAIWVRVFDTYRVPDPMGMDMIFYSWVAPVPDPNWDEYGTGIFFHPRVTRWVPDTLLPI
jgi:hypothetical protein